MDSMTGNNLARTYSPTHREKQKSKREQSQDTYHLLLIVRFEQNIKHEILMQSLWVERYLNTRCSRQR